MEKSSSELGFEWKWEKMHCWDLAKIGQICLVWKVEGKVIITNNQRCGTGTETGTVGT